MVAIAAFAFASFRAASKPFAPRGSAVDAAIAMGAALSVLYPHMDERRRRRVLADLRRKLASRALPERPAGRAAKSASLDWFRSRGMNENPAARLPSRDADRSGRGRQAGARGTKSTGGCRFHATYRRHRVRPRGIPGDGKARTLDRDVCRRERR